MNFNEKKLSAELLIKTNEEVKTFYINQDPKANQLYIDCKIDMMGGDKGKAQIKIYGLSGQTMESCTIRNYQSTVYIGNLIKIYADGIKIITGEIYKSVPNYEKAPNISLDIECFLSENGMKNRVSSVQQTIFPTGGDYRSVSIHDAISYIATEICRYRSGSDVAQNILDIGKKYTAAGSLFGRATDKLPYRLYFIGTPQEILDDFCKNFGIQYYIDNKNVLQYYSVGNFVPDPLTAGEWFISAGEKTLYGYPKATDTGVNCTCAFTPGMQIGDKINLITIVPGLSKEYVISKAEAYLSTRDGKWEIEIEALRYA